MHTHCEQNIFVNSLWTVVRKCSFCAILQILPCSVEKMLQFLIKFSAIVLILPLGGEGKIAVSTMIRKFRFVM
jgi:hypothetical protein